MLSTSHTARTGAITMMSAALATAAVMFAAPASVSASSLNAGLSAKPAHVDARPALTRVAGFKRERKYFGDYMTTCRPDGACDTITFTEIPTSNGQKFSSSLTFKRQRGADAPWFLTFSGVFLGPMEVKIGSQSWTLQPGSGYGQFMAFNYFAPPLNATIVGEMVAGSTMEITQTKKDGSQQTVSYSLRGLTAAMKWIDAKQGRTDTTQAIGVPATLEDAVPQ
ncbi:MAG: hypothetical protein KDJ62_05650 [Rhodobiaceae bacterium]|nr:hypothetical protein [Rhodobiaceae bacterium]